MGWGIYREGKFRTGKEKPQGDHMTLFDLSATILRTKHQIDQLKQQIVAADPKDKPRLRHQLKELQILQLWQLSQKDNRPPGSGRTEPG
jgi:hypothetical protein